MKDENGEEYILLANGKRMYIMDSFSPICPGCGLFRRESKVCTKCRRAGCENCVCGEGVCMSCDLGTVR